MKIPDAVLDFTRWAGQEGGIGRFIISKGHKGGIATGVEQIIKLKELDTDTAELLRVLCHRLGCLRANIICETNGGEPDRIEVYRLRS